jgi:hypothetical protein
MVIRIADAVVSEPATSMNNPSASHFSWLKPFRIHDPYSR